MNPQIFYIVLGAAAFIIILLAVILIALISNRSHSPLSEIQQKLGSLEAAATQMQEIGREVGSLKSVLHAPKLRGNFGEYLLYNLLKDPFESGFDLILCRNVVIYFTEEAKDQLYANFFKALKPGGILFVGATEAILNFRKLGYTSFQPFFYQKPLT